MSDGPDAPDALAALVGAVERLRADVDEQAALVADLRAGAGGGPAGARVYPGWQAWVDAWLVPRVSRHPHRHRWCHRYAEHLEVAERLEALWHAWEDQWPHPAQRLSWLRDGLDHQLTVVMSGDGPLRECSAWESQHVDPGDLRPVTPGRGP